MQKYLAEFFGTFMLVLIGTGAIVLNDETGNIGHLGISLAFGIIVLLMIILFAKISGAHINPAVTLAFYLAGTFPKQKVILFIIAQLLGATIASLALNNIFQLNKNLGATLPKGTWQESFLLEFIMTFILMLVIFILANRRRIKVYQAAFVIGIVIFLEAYFGGPISGASMNPARSFGPAVVSGNMQYLWIYILAPILGASVAVLSNKIMKQYFK